MPFVLVLANYCFACPGCQFYCMSASDRDLKTGRRQTPPQTQFMRKILGCLLSCLQREPAKRRRRTSSIIKRPHKVSTIASTVGSRLRSQRFPPKTISYPLSGTILIEIIVAAKTLIVASTTFTILSWYTRVYF